MDVLAIDDIEVDEDVIIVILQFICGLVVSFCKIVSV